MRVLIQLRNVKGSLAASFVAAAACLLSAQTINLSGTVVASDSSPIAGCQVIMTARSLIDTAVTDASGRFSFTAVGIADDGRNIPLPAGSYVEGDMLRFNTDGGMKQVSIDILDIRGRKIGTALNQRLPAGSYGIHPLASVSSGLSNGVYIIKVRIGSYKGAHKLINQGQASLGRSLFRISGHSGYSAAARQAGVQADTAALSLRHPQYVTKSVQVYNLTAGNLGMIVLTRLHVGPVLSGPTTSTGSFTLTWTFTWPMIGSSSDHWELEQSTASSTSGFSVINQSASGVYPQPASQALTRTAGTYYYRIRAYLSSGYTAYSNVITVTVQSAATVRIVNNTKYDMFSIRLNNAEQLASGYILAVGASWDLTFTSGGTVSYTIRVGLMDAYGATTEFFNYTGSVQAVVGQVATITCSNPTLGQLLSGFASSRNWVGDYYDANLGMHYAAYTISSSGSFVFKDNTAYTGAGGTQIGSGTATLVSWPNRATIIQFRLGTTETINLAYPFGSFQQRNGPASWPIIQYTGR